MLSRRAAYEIAETYRWKFWPERRGSIPHSNDEIYDFLYKNNYETWFLNSVLELDTRSERSLQDFIMRLHTGESINAPNWSLEDRQRLGHSILERLANDIINFKNEDPEEFEFNELEESVDKIQKLLELDA